MSKNNKGLSVEKLVVHLRKLVAVEQEGSQAAAADSLNIERSTFSEGLRALSEHLGVKIIEAKILTDEGRALARRCAPILASLDDVVRNASKMTMLRVGMTHYIARNFLDQSMPTDTALYFYQADASTLFTQLRNGMLDIVVGPTPPGFDNYGISMSGQCEVPYRLVANRQDFRVDEYNQLPSEHKWQFLLFQDKWALNGPGTLTRQRLDHVLRHHNLPSHWWTSHTVAESSDEVILLEIVKRTPGALAILPWGPAMDKASGDVIVRLDLPMPPDLWPKVLVGTSELKESPLGISISRKLSKAIDTYMGR